MSSVLVSLVVFGAVFSPCVYPHPLAISVSFFFLFCFAFSCLSPGYKLRSILFSKYFCYSIFKECKACSTMLPLSEDRQKYNAMIKAGKSMLFIRILHSTIKDGISQEKTKGNEEEDTTSFLLSWVGISILVTISALVAYDVGEEIKKTMILKAFMIAPLVGLMLTVGEGAAIKIVERFSSSDDKNIEKTAKNDEAIYNSEIRADYISAIQRFSKCKHDNGIEYYQNRLSHYAEKTITFHRKYQKQNIHNIAAVFIVISILIGLVFLLLDFMFISKFFLFVSLTTTLALSYLVLKALLSSELFAALSQAIDQIYTFCDCAPKSSLVHSE